MISHQTRAILLSFLLLILAGPLTAGEQGVHASAIVDEDGDEAILMESEWISMQLLPWRQALINSFVFRPTGNDIVAATNPKHRMGGGGGILMDCLWEQDWRFQELAYKQYKYTVTKNGPDEAQVVFETDIEGWLGAANSGVISNLISNLTLRRTVSLKAGQPFFRLDFEFINNDRWAKRPSFWIHNMSIISQGSGKDTVVRPSDEGLAALGGDQESYSGPRGQQFISNYTHGWTASLSKERREGIVYLMDYDYMDKLYNCFEDNGSNGTTEWWYDSILAFKDKPWKGRAYILPIIGLSRIDHANPHFILAMQPRREEGRLIVEYSLTSSYESVSQVTLQTQVESKLEEEKRDSVKAPSVSFDGLAIQPAKQRFELDLTAEDPLLFKVKAFVELPDGGVKTYSFENFYAGNYKLNRNIKAIGAGPLVTMERPVKNPSVPAPPAGLSINTKAFNVFGIHGIGTYRLGVSEAIQTIPNANYTIGYCTGSDAPMNGLTEFPYDYERLFDQRVLVFSNIQDKEFRRIGASILLPWLEAGGGLVILGGQFSFTFEHREHPINRYYPLVARENNLERGACQLQKPLVADHPVFQGVDLSQLPWLHYTHRSELKTDAKARVLMKVGDLPFIIERQEGKQITMVVTINPFGRADAFDGKVHVRNWDQWPKLFSNIVRYAAGDLK